jgi:hypothetical protein
VLIGIAKMSVPISFAMNNSIWQGPIDGLKPNLGREVFLDWNLASDFNLVSGL